MALWRSLCEMCRRDATIKDKVTNLYATYNLSHKIRSTFATWIEATNWDIREQSKIDQGKRLFDTLMGEIDSKVKELKNSNLDAELDLEKARENLSSFQGCYDTFVDNMRFVLRGEQEIISQFVSDQRDPELKRKSKQKVSENFDPNYEALEVDRKLKEMNGRIVTVSTEQSELLLNIKDKQEKLANIQKTNHPNTEPNQKKLCEEHQKAKNRIISIRKELFEKIKEGTKLLLNVLGNVWQERNEWALAMKREYAGLYSIDNNSIQRLDMQFRKANELLLGWITMIDKAINYVYYCHIQEKDGSYELKDFFKDFKETVLPNHLRQILVIENQARILKVNGKKSNSFQLLVRMLGGLQLDQKHRSPKVSIAFLPESELQKIDFSILTSEASTPSNTGVDSAPISFKKTIAGICEIENGQDRSFQEDSGNSSFLARFYSLQLKNLQRLEKPKGNEYVTDFKYGFLVQTSITLLDKTYLLKEVSLPVIITSQTSQEIMAKGTLIWHAAFADDEVNGSNSRSYAVREKVTWKDFAIVISHLYLKHAERELSPDHLHYLASMIFKVRNAAATSQNYFDHLEVSYSQIMKDKLPKKEFSLWKWLQACLNLVSTLIKKEWKEGHIYGFISKEDAKKKLEGRPCGTFLLRFSESHIDTSQKSDLCGYLTVAVQELDPESGDLKLFHVRDYLSPKDIDEKGLAAILSAMEVADYSNHKIKHKLLKYLWPDNKTLSDIFAQNLDQNKFQNKEINPGYSGGQFSIEIFLSERRQTRESGMEDMQISNPSSVNSYMSSESSMDGWFQPNLMGILDEGLPNSWNINSPKPTAKVTPAIHHQVDDLVDLGSILSEDLITNDISDLNFLQGNFEDLEENFLEQLPN